VHAPHTEEVNAAAGITIGDSVAKTRGADLVGWDMPITAANPFKWRHYPGDVILVVRPVVSAVSDFGGANGGDDRGKRVRHQLELHLAVDSGLRSGTGQTAPETSESDE
jgi:hypothetical protein